MSPSRRWAGAGVIRDFAFRSTMGLLVCGMAVMLARVPSLDAQETGAPASSRITGNVVEHETEQPVEEAVVRVLPDGPEGLTDSRGAFSLTGIRPGSYELEVHHVAYGTALVPVEVRPGESVHLELTVEARAVEVAPLEVTVERESRSNYLLRHGFYDRMERGFGHHWTPAELERRDPLRVSHVLQQTPGVELIRQCGSGRCVHLPTMGASTPRFAPDGSLVSCTATVYLDGHKVDLGRGMGVDDIVNAMNLAAVEVYRGASASAPGFVDSGSRCGVVALWTRRGPKPSGR